jgi:hypothetical protein
LHTDGEKPPKPPTVLAEAGKCQLSEIVREKCNVIKMRYGAISTLLQRFDNVIFLTGSAKHSLLACHKPILRYKRRHIRNKKGFEFNAVSRTILILKVQSARRVRSEPFIFSNPSAPGWNYQSVYYCTKCAPTGNRTQNLQRQRLRFC